MSDWKADPVSLDEAWPHPSGFHLSAIIPVNPGHLGFC